MKNRENETNPKQSNQDNNSMDFVGSLLMEMLGIKHRPMAAYYVSSDCSDETIKELEAQGYKHFNNFDEMIEYLSTQSCRKDEDEQQNEDGDNESSCGSCQCGGTCSHDNHEPDDEYDEDFDEEFMEDILDHVDSTVTGSSKRIVKKMKKGFKKTIKNLYKILDIKFKASDSYQEKLINEMTIRIEDCIHNERREMEQYIGQVITNLIQQIEFSNERVIESIKVNASCNCKHTDAPTEPVSDDTEEPNEETTGDSKQVKDTGSKSCDDSKKKGSKSKGSKS